KVPAVIEELSGIRLTQGALSQAACGLCEEGAPMHAHYMALREEISRSEVVNTDDTGWRINATGAYLMGFFTETAAVYQIRPQHRHQEVMEVIGETFGGLLGTDRGTSYEAHAFDKVKMQKCLSHALNNLSEVEKTKTGRAAAFAAGLKTTLRDGIRLWHEQREGNLTLQAYRRRGAHLKAKLAAQLRDRTLSDADNQRLLDGLGTQMDRGRFTLFLSEPRIEPTNNRAERGLRPAVIARKLSHCSKNNRG